MKNNKKKLLETLFSCVFLILTSSILLLLIDPRGIFNFITLKNINEKKFSFFMRETFIKPYQVKTYNPKFVILGNSVASTAFDAKHPYFNSKKTYSYGVAGSGIYINYRSYQHMHDKKPDAILQLLDYSAFFSNSPTNHASAIENSDTGKRLAFSANGEINNSAWFQKFKDYSLLASSFEIANDAIESIMRQNEDGWHLLPDGTWGGGSSQAGKPQRKRFLFVEKETFMRPLTSNANNQPFFINNASENTLMYFENYLNALYADGMTTTLMIPPAHARVYETLFVQNRWTDYRQWKKLLVLTNIHVAATHNQTPFPIWDFSGYNSFSTEPVPVMMDKTTRMQWFYDSVHIKPDLGRKVLDTMMLKPSDNTFGMLLTINNVETQLQSMYQAHLIYQLNHPEDINDIQQSCEAVFHDAERCNGYSSANTQ